MPDAVDTVIWYRDDGWKYHPKHVERFTDINILYRVASCSIIFDIYMSLLLSRKLKFIKNKHINNSKIEIWTLLICSKLLATGYVLSTVPWNDTRFIFNLQWVKYFFKTQNIGLFSKKYGAREINPSVKCSIQLTATAQNVLQNLVVVATQVKNIDDVKQSICNNLFMDTNKNIRDFYRGEN
jgi:hypothetical protein